MTPSVTRTTMSSNRSSTLSSKMRSAPLTCARSVRPQGSSIQPTRWFYSENSSKFGPASKHQLTRAKWAACSPLTTSSSSCRLRAASTPSTRSVRSATARIRLSRSASLNSETSQSSQTGATHEATSCKISTLIPALLSIVLLTTVR